MKTKWECKGKRQFNSKQEAQRYIYQNMVDSLSNTTFLMSYKCKFCKKHHLTSRQN